MNKNLIILIIGVLLAVGAAFYWRQSATGWQTYDAQEFSIDYPDYFILETGSNAAGAFLDTPLLRLSLPKSLLDPEAKTNFVEAFLTLSSSKTSRALASCLTFSDVPNISSPDTLPKNINGLDFKTQAAVGVAAGNVYTSHLYRTLKDNTCYEAALTVHTGNLGNYAAGTVTEFNQQQAFNILENVLGTLRLK